MSKKVGVGFKVDESIGDIWNKKSSELIKKRFFRSKTEIFELMALYLLKSTDKEILEFREKVTSQQLN